MYRVICLKELYGWPYERNNIIRYIFCAKFIQNG